MRGRRSLGRQQRIGPPEKVGIPRPPRRQGCERPRQPPPARRPRPAPPGGEGSGYSPCRERNSKGARGEPRQVIPGPRGARPPSARLLVEATEARAGLSALSGQYGPPRATARPQSVQRGWDSGARRPGECNSPPRSTPEAELRACAFRARRTRPAAPRPPRAALGPAGP